LLLHERFIFHWHWNRQCVMRCNGACNFHRMVQILAWNRPVKAP
jgi:hypothetical protein